MILPRQDDLITFLQDLPAGDFVRLVADLLHTALGHRVVRLAGGQDSGFDELVTQAPDGRLFLVHCRSYRTALACVTPEDVARLAEALAQAGASAGLIATNTELSVAAIATLQHDYRSRGVNLDWWDGERIAELAVQHPGTAGRWLRVSAQTGGVTAVRFHLTVIDMPAGEFNLFFRPFTAFDGARAYWENVEKLTVQETSRGQYRVYLSDGWVAVSQDLLPGDRIGRVRAFARQHRYGYGDFAGRIGTLRCTIEGPFLGSDMETRIRDVVGLVGRYLRSVNPESDGWIVVVRSALEVPTFLAEFSIPAQIVADRERGYLIAADGQVVEEEDWVFDLGPDFRRPPYVARAVRAFARPFDPLRHLVCDVRVSQPISAKSEQQIAFEMARAIDLIGRSKHFSVAPADLFAFHALLGPLGRLADIFPVEGRFIVSIQHPKKYLPLYPRDESGLFVEWERSQGRALEAEMYGVYSEAQARGLDVRPLTQREIETVLIPRVEANHPRYEFEMAGPDDELLSPVNLFGRALTFSTVVLTDVRPGDADRFETDVLAPLTERFNLASGQLILLSSIPESRPAGDFALSFDLDEFHDGLAVITRLTWRPATAGRTRDIVAAGRDYFLGLVRELMAALSARQVGFRSGLEPYYLQTYHIDYRG
jgi:hypothetical protein